MEPGALHSSQDEHPLIPAPSGHLTLYPIPQTPHPNLQGRGRYVFSKSHIGWNGSTPYTFAIASPDRVFLTGSLREIAYWLEWPYSLNLCNTGVSPLRSAPP
eukprot:CAMPEP_0182860318 /NCGR_PEP_ID=MMETSP0034_2-20130328/4850_1 /TAXON_ID=156128 /ORGANISM="Nephroselmis pyriformis, Strain CCMP717" /LENGTH=101 /DNA_ID=CAMNT_0024992101 /DNA_START=225 /DNA_END=530 /DNA_ORIENTATION=+